MHNFSVLGMFLLAVSDVGAAWHISGMFVRLRERFMRFIWGLARSFSFVLPLMLVWALHDTDASYIYIGCSYPSDGALSIQRARTQINHSRT